MFIEPIIRDPDRIPVVLVQRAMQLIGATFCYEHDLRSRRAPRIGIGIAGSDPELLERIQGRAKSSSERVPSCLVVIVDPVQYYVRLVAAAPLTDPPRLSRS